MKLFGTNPQSSVRTGLQAFNRRLLVIFYAAVSALSAGAVEAGAMDVDPAFLQLTQSIDIRTAAAVSALSLIVMAALSKADFKGNFGIWGGRFIIFVLVVLNIGLWATQA